MKVEKPGRTKQVVRRKGKAAALFADALNLAKHSISILISNGVDAIKTEQDKIEAIIFEHPHISCIADLE